MLVLNKFLTLNLVLSPQLNVKNNVSHLPVFMFQQYYLSKYNNSLDVFTYYRNKKIGFNRFRE
jgi:hypothetical protein